jgi:hypothetical protein
MIKRGRRGRCQRRQRLAEIERAPPPMAITQSGRKARARASAASRSPSIGSRGAESASIPGSQPVPSTARARAGSAPWTISPRAPKARASARARVEVPRPNRMRGGWRIAKVIPPWSPRQRGASGCISPRASGRPLPARSGGPAPSLARIPRDRHKGPPACRQGRPRRARWSRSPGPVDGGAEDVGQELHRPVAGRHAAIDPQHALSAAAPQSARIASSRSRVW